MSLIEEFIKRVKNGEQSFEIKKGEGIGYNYIFMLCPVGKAKYVYCDYSSYEHFCSSLDTKLTLAAIVDENMKIYIINPYKLGIYPSDQDKMPDNVVELSCKEADLYVANEIFPKFYTELPIQEITDEDSLSNLKKQARRILLSKDSSLEVKRDVSFFKQQDIADSICGFIDLTEEAKKRLLEYRDYWIHVKSTNAKIKEFMDDKNTLADWEREIAEGLSSVEAKAVSIEFELNGKTAIGKMTPETIIYNMVEGDNFDDYDFCTRTQGKALINKLGAKTWRHEDNCLMGTNIKSITYGKKVLYERELGL